MWYTEILGVQLLFSGDGECGEVAASDTNLLRATVDTYYTSVRCSTPQPNGGLCYFQMNWAREV